MSSGKLGRNSSVISEKLFCSSSGLSENVTTSELHHSDLRKLDWGSIIMAETENILQSPSSKLSVPPGFSKSERRFETLTEKQLNRAIKLYGARRFPFCYDADLLIQDVVACKRLQEQARKRTGCPYIMLNDVSYLKKIRRKFQRQLSCQLNRSYSIKKDHHPVVHHRTLSDSSYRYCFPLWYKPGYCAKAKERFDEIRVNRSSLTSKTRNKAKKKWYHRILRLLFLRLFSSGRTVDEILDKVMPLDSGNMEEIFEVAEKLLVHTRCRSAPLKRIYPTKRRRKSHKPQVNLDNTGEEDQRIMLEPETGVSEIETNLQYPITRDEQHGSISEDAKEQWTEEYDYLNPDSETNFEHIMIDKEVSQPNVTDQLLRSDEDEKGSTVIAVDNKRRSDSVRNPTRKGKTSQNINGMGQHLIQKEESSSSINTVESVSTDIGLESPHSIHEDGFLEVRSDKTSGSAENKPAPNS